MGRRLVVVEANEIPPRLFEWYAQKKPMSTIARIMAEGSVGRTEVFEDVPRQIYPSQTWASLGMGAPYKDHGVWWYGDPKPDECPFYWQVAAEHLTVGMVGVLHSSPLQRQCRQSGMAFVIPDVFADNNKTLPTSLTRVQSFNLQMAQENARTVSSTRPSLEYVFAGLSAMQNGLRLKTAARLGVMVAGVAAKRIPKERLRTGQFLLLDDLHAKLTRRYNPDLSILFTNHVAAAMHRYWYALFPDDWDEALYDDSWVKRFAGEIPAAMDSLDRSLDQLTAWCEHTDRTLLIITSMGQHGDRNVKTEATKVLIVADGKAFSRALGVTGAYTVHANMVPQVALKFDSEHAASEAAEHLASRVITGSTLSIDKNQTTLTISYQLDSSDENLEVDGVRIPFSEAGLVEAPISDHTCGTHHPVGTMMVWNSPDLQLGDQTVDYLEVAPAILTSIGINPLEHHRTPSFRL